MGIGERIKLIRGDPEEDGLTQEQFASKIGVSQSTVQNWEKGGFPKGDHLRSIHENCRVDIHWLLTGVGKPYIGNDVKAVHLETLKDVVISPIISHPIQSDDSSDPFLNAISHLKKVFDAGDESLKHIVMVCLEVVGVASDIIKNQKDLSQTIDNLRQIINSHHPPEKDDERREAWMEMKKVIGID